MGTLGQTIYQAISDCGMLRERRGGDPHTERIRGNSSRMEADGGGNTNSPSPKAPQVSKLASVLRRLRSSIGGRPIRSPRTEFTDSRKSDPTDCADGRIPILDEMVRTEKRRGEKGSVLVPFALARGEGPVDAPLVSGAIAEERVLIRRLGNGSSRTRRKDDLARMPGV